MVDILLKTFFFSMILSIIIGLYYHYRFQYLIFFKVRPLLKRHGLKNSGIFPLRYKKDLRLYEKICSKNDIEPDLSASVRISEKRSWILIIICSVCCIVFLMLKPYSG